MVGAAVEANRPLLRIVNDDLQARRVVKRQTLEQLENEIELLRAKANIDLAWRLREIDGEILDTQLKSAELLRDQFRQRIEAVSFQQRLDDQDSLAISTDDALYRSMLDATRLDDDDRAQLRIEQETAQQSAALAESQIALCERRLDDLQALREKIVGQVENAHGLSTAQRRLQAVTTELVELETRHNALAVKTATFGVVGRFRCQTGDHVQPGDTLVEVLDPQRRFILVDVSSKKIEQYARGTEVTLDFPGGIRRKGVVDHIAPQALPADGGDAKVPVRIEQVDKRWPDVPFGTAIDIRLRLF